MLASVTWIFPFVDDWVTLDKTSCDCRAEYLLAAMCSHCSYVFSWLVHAKDANTWITEHGMNADCQLDVYEWRAYCNMLIPYHNITKFLWVYFCMVNAQIAHGRPCFVVLNNNAFAFNIFVFPEPPLMASFIARHRVCNIFFFFTFLCSWTITSFWMPNKHWVSVQVEPKNRRAVKRWIVIRT